MAEGPEKSLVELANARPEWLQNYQDLSKTMEEQKEQVQKLYHKVMSLRYRTALLGLRHLQTAKELQTTKEKVKKCQPMK